MMLARTLFAAAFAIGFAVMRAGVLIALARTAVFAAALRAVGTLVTVRTLLARRASLTVRTLLARRTFAIGYAKYCRAVGAVLAT